MKKTLLFLCATLFFYVINIKTAFCQNAYEDAVALKTYLNANSLWTDKDPNVIAILKKYIDQNSTTGVFQQNPFIKVYMPPIWSSSGITGFLSTAGTGLGNLNVTNLADGIAQFLIERAEGEINEAFFVQLQNFLKNYPEFALLFPSTNTFLANSNTWEYSNLLNTLKEAFNKDLQQLPANIIKLKDLTYSGCPTDAKNGTDCKTRIKIITDFLHSADGRLLLSGLQIGNGVINRQKMPDIVNSVVDTAFLLGYTIKNDPVATSNVQNGLQLINIINLSLESSETGKDYITTDQFKVLETDVTTRNIYLGLIYQEAKSKQIKFKVGQTTINVTDILTLQNVNNIISYVTNVYNQAKNVQTAIDNLKNDRLNAKSDLSPDYAALVENTQQLLQALSSVSLISSQITFSKDIQNVFLYSNQTLGIANDVLIKNYSAAIMTTLNLLSSAATNYQSNLTAVIQPNNSGKKSTKKSGSTVSQNQTDATTLNNFFISFMKYASFAANIVQAKTPDDVKSAIEAIALPVGSYTVKQKSANNISLNGFLGYAFDFKRLDVTQGLYANGIYAPVGFSLTWGSSKKNGWPVGFFASIIDVGPFVSYNLQNSSTSTLKQDTRLESIFSPSLQLSTEIPHTPIAFVAGWRRTPKLFYTKSDNTFMPVKAQDVLNVSILIDIPILTLHNTPFK